MSKDGKIDPLVVKIDGYEVDLSNGISECKLTYKPENVYSIFKHINPHEPREFTVTLERAKVPSLLAHFLRLMEGDKDE